MWPFKKSDPTSAFWKWFHDNSRLLLAMKGPHEPTMNAITARLHEIHPDLVYEIEVHGALRRFVVSADGNRALFPLVLDIVKQAPAIPGWSIAAFRQPGPMNVG